MHTKGGDSQGKGNKESNDRSDHDDNRERQHQIVNEAFIQTLKSAEKPQHEPKIYICDTVNLGNPSKKNI